MRIEYFTLIAASIYVATEYVPCLWWALFVWISLLLHIFVNRFSTIKVVQALYLGLLWGFVINAGCSGGVLFGLSAMASGPFFLRWAIPLLLFFYQISLSGIWFVLVYCGICRTNKSRDRLVIGFFGICAFFFFLQRVSLAPLGMCVGNPFLNPLRALLEKPFLLKLVSIVGSAGFFALIIAISTLAYSCYLRPTKASIVATLTCCVVLGIYYYHCSKQLSAPSPSWLSHIAIVSHQFHARHSVSDVISSISCACKKIISSNPEITTIFFPESSVYRINCLYDGARLLEQEFYTHAIDVHLLIGGFRTDKNVCRNSIWWYKKGVLQSICDKRHTLPFSEAMPSLFRCDVLFNAYFDEFVEIEAAHTPYSVWECIPHVESVIYICSELFFAWNTQDAHSNTLLIALCNDSWAPVYTRKQMLRTIRMRALEWSRNILYITHSYCYYFAADGAQTNLSDQIFCIG